MTSFLMRLFNFRRRKQQNFGESIEVSFLICVSLKKPEIDKKIKVIDGFLFQEIPDVETLIVTIWEQK